MRLDLITEFAVKHLFGRLLYRAMGAALLVLFTLTAVYHFTIAGTLVLEAEYGMLYARLIIATIYFTAALITVIVLWTTRTKPLIKDRGAVALASPRNMQIAVLIEAAMIGYALARRSGDRPRGI